ncbi:LeuD/DmdB family oxidoreductase small subunit [Dongshaea marina]|uniref:LeuD/DmdB family oxidoreductase small subunit n=1 Tax=Dongshaea marina TaxID=2047966 RepID=UPI000D3EAFB8|nr:3-isopropylmalate dehydratase [Dongshaea marina]
MAKGRIWRLGADINTDLLAPGYAMKYPIPELARYCLESQVTRFSERVQPGDVLVADENFGCGSSRAQAVYVLKHLGIQAVIACSFSRIFYRNAFNFGLPLLVLEDNKGLEDELQVSIDLEQAIISVQGSELVFQASPIPSNLKTLIRSGGLMNLLQQQAKGA